MSKFRPESEEGKEPNREGGVLRRLFRGIEPGRLGSRLLEEREIEDSDIRLAYDLKDTLKANRFVGLWRMATGYRRIYVAAVQAAGFAALSRSAVFYLLRYFVDEVLPGGGGFGAVALVAAGLIGLAAAQGLFAFGMGRMAAKTGEGAARRLRNYLFDHIQRLNFGYHDSMQTGELIQRATSDVDTLRRLFQDQLIGIGRIGLLTVVNFSALVLLHGRLALMSTPLLPAIAVVSFFFFRRIGTVYEAYQSQDAAVSNRLQERLSGVRVVKAFARQGYEIGRFEEENWEKYRRGVRMANLHSLFWPLVEFMIAGQVILGTYLAGMMAVEGAITVGTFVAFTGLLGATVWPMQGIGRLVAHISTGLVSLERVQAIMRQEREALGEESGADSGRLRGEIELRGVQFAYEAPPEQEETGKSETGPAENEAAGKSRQAVRRRAFAARGYVLRDIDLTVEPGQVIGLLGATGSGKSSLVNLLPRFYEYSGGNIRLDGRELRSYGRGFLRSQIGFVQQEPFLFSTTIRNNITYGTGRDVADGEVEAAARAAAIHDVILSFPDGYDTMVGERGVTLSGGQKQRVTVARTLLKDPAILILDDATSSVDTGTDASIRAALRGLMRGRTTFIIAHRVQSVMEADQILVMEGGRVIQRGRHEQLAEEEGVYRRIFELQMQIEADLEREIAEVVEATEARLDDLASAGPGDGQDGAPLRPELPSSADRG